MEYLQGNNLDNLLLEMKEQGKTGYSIDEMLQLIQPIAAALDHAHTRYKLIHRDLKPANVYLTDEGEIKVLDFGLADELRQTAASYGSQQQALHSSGTPAYKSPEASVKISPQQDIYALACLSYELLTGKVPFRWMSAPPATKGCDLNSRHSSRMMPGT